jgi:hypothetical protein
MPSVSELIEDVADIMSVPREGVSAYARAMIDDGLLPKSRGRAVAQVEPVHVCRLFIAVAVGPKLRDTVDTVTRYENLVLGGVPESLPKFREMERFGEVMAMVFENLMSTKDPQERKPWLEGRIEIILNWPEAMITQANPEKDLTERFGMPNTAGQGWNGYVKRSTVISGQAFAFLGLKNRRDYFNPDCPS